MRLSSKNGDSSAVSGSSRENFRASALRSYLPADRLTGTAFGPSPARQAPFAAPYSFVKKVRTSGAPTVLGYGVRPDMNWFGQKVLFNPARTTVPFWGQSTYNSSTFSPKRGCGPKRIDIPIVAGPHLLSYCRPYYSFFAECGFATHIESAHNNNAYARMLVYAPAAGGKGHRRRVLPRTSLLLYRHTCREKCKQN